MILKMSPVDNFCLTAIAMPKLKILECDPTSEYKIEKEEKRVSAYQRLQSPCGDVVSDACCI